MRVGTTGIVVNADGHVLLIQRNDSRTFAPPGGALDRNELPSQSVVREVREETGIIVEPERLDGLYYWPIGDEGLLSFVFRCQPQSGALTPSTESPQVCYAAPDQLPRRMADVHRERILRTLAHREQRPFWYTQRSSWRTQLTYFLITNIVYRWLDLQRRLRGQKPYQPPPEWDITTNVIVHATAGKVIWVRNGDGRTWRLPGGEAHVKEAPWTTAERITLQQTGLRVQLSMLSSIYLKRGQSHMELTFTGRVPTGTAVGASINGFAPGAEPPSCLPHHVAHVSEATNPTASGVAMRWQAQPQV